MESLRQYLRHRILQALLGDEVDQIDDAHRVAPFVVIPGQDFDEIAVQDLGHLGVPLWSWPDCGA